MWELNVDLTLAATPLAASMGSLSCKIPAAPGVISMVTVGWRRNTLKKMRYSLQTRCAAKARVQTPPTSYLRMRVGTRGRSFIRQFMELQ